MIGAGGHARVVVDLLMMAGLEVRSVHDEAEHTWGQTVFGVPVVGGLQTVEFDVACPVVVAVGGNDARRRIVDQLKAQGAVFAKAIHPSAIVSPRARIGAGSVVCAGAVVQAGAEVREHCIVNTGATVDHDCLLEDFAQICPGVHLAGGVQLGRATFVGTGANLVPGIIVGEQAIVGAGATVLSNVSAGRRVFGLPAREE